jgi:uncharacterized protein YndB with AHSA1/START domain
MTDHDTMSSYGVVTEAGTVRFERLLPGPIERVWSFLTESDKRGTWLAKGEMELRPGGKAELHWHHADLSSEKEPPPKYKELESGHSATWSIVRCEQPRLLVCLWPMESGKKSEVTFELSERGSDVLLVLTHRRLDRATMLSVVPGWHAHLAILEDRLAGAEPRPFWSTHARLEREYDKRLGSA